MLFWRKDKDNLNRVDTLVNCLNFDVAKTIKRVLDLEKEVANLKLVLTSAALVNKTSGKKLKKVVK